MAARHNPLRRASVAPSKTVEIHLPQSPLGAELTIDPANGEFLVASVLANSMAEVHGLERGHQLTKVNGALVRGKSMAQLGALVTAGKKATLTFLCHNFDNPTLWAKMLSRGTFMMYKDRSQKRYRKMYMWADCHAGTLKWAPERQSPERMTETLRITDITEISAAPPTGPEHEAHQKRLDMLHHLKTHAQKYKSGGASAGEKAAWVKAQKKAHKKKRSKATQGCIELGCYVDGYLVYDHTKDLKIDCSGSAGEVRTRAGREFIPPWGSV